MGAETLALLARTPIFDYRATETRAAATARFTAFLADVSAFGGGEIQRGQFLLDPVSFDGNATITLTDDTTLDFSQTTTSAPLFQLGNDAMNELPALAADVLRDTYTLTFVSPPGVVPGQKVLVEDTRSHSWISAAVAGDNRPYYHAGEWKTVEAVSGNTVTTVDPILHDYAALETLKVYAPTMRRINLVGGLFRGVYDPNANNAVIVARNLLGAHIETQAYEAEQAGLSLRRCVESVVDRFRFNDYGENISLNYGLSLIACSDIAINDPFIRSTRHGITITGGGITGSIPNRRIRGKGGTVAGNSLAIDSHGAAEFISFREMDIIGGATLGGDYTDVIDCNIWPGKIGNYTGVAVEFRERKGHNANLEGLKIHPVMNGGGRYLINCTALNNDVGTTVSQLDQGGLTRVHDMTIYSDQNISLAMRFGGGCAGTQRRDIEVSDVRYVPIDPAVTIAPVLYFDSTGTTDWRNVTVSGTQGLTIRTVDDFIAQNVQVDGASISGSLNNGVKIDMGTPAAGVTQTVTLRDLNVKLSQNAGIRLTANGKTDGNYLRIYDSISEANSQDTTTTAAERAAIFIDGFRDVEIRDPSIGDTQMVQTQTKGIAVQNCGAVRVTDIVRLGVARSDDFATGNDSVRVTGRNPYVETRSDTVNISGMTVASNGAFIRLTGTLTADRTITLSTAGAADGDQRTYVRTGGGAFNWSIGGLTNLAQNQGCLVVYDKTAGAWFLAMKWSLT